jgi:MscS family membrane protein
MTVSSALSSRYTASLLVCWLAVTSVVVRAQEADKPPASQPTIETLLASPRSTLRTFLVAMQDNDLDRAAACLDLSRINEERRAQQGQELVPLLKDLIDLRLPKIRLEIYSEDPDYLDGNNRHELAITTTKDEDGQERDEIVLARGVDGLWRFSKGTVAAIPELYRPLQTRPAATQPTLKAGVPEYLASARATMRTFLEAMAKQPPDIERAMECLDLSNIDVVLLRQSGPEAARSLKDILDLTGQVVLKTISREPEGNPFVFYSYDKGDIVIARIDNGEHKGQWRFTKETVEKLGAIAGEAYDKGIAKGVDPKSIGISKTITMRKRMPRWLQDKFLGVAYWKWIGLFILIVLGFVLDAATRIILRVIIAADMRRRDLSIESSELNRYLRPVGLVVMGVVWWKGQEFLLLPQELGRFLSPAAQFLAAIAAVWSVYRLVDLLCGYLAARARKTKSKYDDLLVPMLSKSLKLIVSVMGLAFLTETFNWPLSKVLAGLGIGGLAFGFAARETIQNFFGSLTVLIDRPFQIGDWIKIEGIEGTVETVGFRSTRIRTFYNSLITVPNIAMLTAQVDNMGARRYRRIKAMLSLTYDTPPEKIDAFCEGVRSLIRQHPYTRKDYYLVYFNEFGDASLNVLLYCFHECPDWGTELRERHRLFNDILRLSQKVGVEFAFPTQTLHMYQETAPPTGTKIPAPADPERAGRQSAADIVRETGLTGTVPPPVTYDNVETRGSSDDDSGEAGD